MNKHIATAIAGAALLAAPVFAQETDAAERPAAARTGLQAPAAESLRPRPETGRAAAGEKDETRPAADGERGGVREPTEAERIFREGLDFLLGENGRERNLADAYRRFEEAGRKGCVLGEVGVAHVCWTATEAEKRELKDAGVVPSALYVANWEHASAAGKSRIAKCERALFLLQRESTRAEGLKLAGEAASEGSDTAKMFLAQVANQAKRSGLSSGTVAGLLADNGEIMALFQKACAVELAKEYTLSLKKGR